MNFGIFGVLLFSFTLLVCSSALAQENCADLFSYPRVVIPPSQKVGDVVRLGIKGRTFLIQEYSENILEGTYHVLEDLLPESGVPSWGINSLEASRLNEIRRAYNVRLILGHFFSFIEVQPDGQVLAYTDVSAMVFSEPVTEFGMSAGEVALLISPNTDMPILEHEIQHIIDARSGLEERFGKTKDTEELFNLLMEIRAMTVEFEALQTHTPRFSTLDGLYANLDMYMQRAEADLMKLSRDERLDMLKRLLHHLKDLPQNEFLEYSRYTLKNIVH